MPTLDEGLYYGRLAQIGTDRLGGETRTPYVYVIWDVTHQAVDGQWRPIGHERRESRWWVTEKAEPYTMDRLEQLGFNGDFASPAFDADPHPQDDGVQLVCSHEVRDERLYERWDLAAARQEKERTPWDDDLKRRFKAKYRTRLSSRSKPDGAPPAPPASPASGSREPDNSPVRDDEIPGAVEGVDVPEGEIPF